MSTIFNADQRRFESGVEFFDLLGADYEDAYGKNIGLLKFIPKAVSLFVAESKVLDAGCGTGTPIASTLASAGHQVTGIDLSPSMIELSRKAVPGARFEVANMLEYTPKEPMDAVLVILSLFLMSLEQMEDMCRKHIPFRFMGQNSELTLLTKEGWDTILGRVGFEVVHTEEYWFVPPAEADSDPEMEYFIIARKKS